jgi:hypothetical protein
MAMPFGKTVMGGAVLCCAAAFALGTGEAWAKSGSHGSSSHSGGARASFAAHPHSFHHHRRGSRTFVFFGSSAFFGGPFGYPYGPPYYYGPDYAASSEPPQVYVERFDGQPTPQTQGDIFCPGTGAYYPAVTECPGGWQRVIRPEG